MVDVKKYLIFIVIFINACSSLGDSFSVDIQKKYEKGLDLFGKEKFTRAREQFEFIIMNNPGSKLSIDAQFYLAESMFNNEDYVEASSAYSKYIRWATESERIENARYKIANCAVNSVNKYQLDQGEAKIALNLLQEFIDDYPYSSYINNSDMLVEELRNKLAKKEYETARLYIKLEKFSAAIIYLNEVINNYYDTEYYEKAHLGIMLAYNLNNNDSLLLDYYNKNIKQIILEENIIKAKKIKDSNLSSIELFKQIYR